MAGNPTTWDGVVAASGPRERIMLDRDSTSWVQPGALSANTETVTALTLAIRCAIVPYFPRMNKYPERPIAAKLRLIDKFSFNVY